MFSRILIKLIDQSIVPAIMLVTARIISLVLVARYFGIEYTVGSQGIVYSDAGGYVLVNSYSVFIMVVLLSVGIMYILLKALLFHETHIAPHLTARLFSLKLSSVIQNSFDLYSQGSIWLSYLYLILLTSGVMAYYGLIYTWVFYVSLILTILTSVLFVFDVENELNLHKGSTTDKTEEFILEFKE